VRVQPVCDVRPSVNRRKVTTIAPRAFNRTLFGYRRQDVDAAIAWRDSAIGEETKRADRETVRADAATARINEETRRADHAVMRAAELEQASLDLAGRVNALEQVADRLALRVVERERAILKLTERLDEPAETFAGLIEVEVGPLSDFDQLASFEDAASEIRAAKHISVKRFAEGRATLEVDLSEPVALLLELEERAPFEFTVRDAREDRVVLDVDGQ